jgi:hypothetical protein
MARRFFGQHIEPQVKLVESDQMSLSLSYWYMMCESSVGVAIWLQTDRFMPDATSRFFLSKSYSYGHSK